MSKNVEAKNEDETKILQRQCAGLQQQNKVLDDTDLTTSAPINSNPSIATIATIAGAATIDETRLPIGMTADFSEFKHCTVFERTPGMDTDPAIFFLHSDLIDISTKAQIRSMFSHTSLSHIRIMPDGHAGYGCCVGFTAKLCNDAVVPAYVGGDMGCGILTYPLRKKKLKLERIERKIKNIIPMGEGQGNSHPVPAASESFISRYLQMAQPNMDMLCEKYDSPTVLLDFEYFTNLCRKISADVDATIRSFGTLVRQNHYDQSQNEFSSFFL